MQMIFRFWENLKRLYYIVEKRKKKKWCLGVLLCLQQLLCGLYNDDSTSLLATPTLPTAIPDSGIERSWNPTWNREPGIGVGRVEVASNDVESSL